LNVNPASSKQKKHHILAQANDLVRSISFQGWKRRGLICNRVNKGARIGAGEGRRSNTRVNFNTTAYFSK